MPAAPSAASAARDEQRARAHAGAPPKCRRHRRRAPRRARGRDRGRRTRRSATRRPVRRSSRGRPCERVSGEAHAVALGVAAVRGAPRGDARAPTVRRDTAATAPRAGVRRVQPRAPRPRRRRAAIRARRRGRRASPADGTRASDRGRRGAARSATRRRARSTRARRRSPSRAPAPSRRSSARSSRGRCGRCSFPAARASRATATASRRGAGGTRASAAPRGPPLRRGVGGARVRRHCAGEHCGREHQRDARAARPRGDAIGEAAQRDLDVPAFEQRAAVEIDGEAAGDVERLDQAHRNDVREAVGQREPGFLAGAAREPRGEVGRDRARRGREQVARAGRAPMSTMNSKCAHAMVRPTAKPRSRRASAARRCRAARPVSCSSCATGSRKLRASENRPSVSAYRRPGRSRSRLTRVALHRRGLAEHRAREHVQRDAVERRLQPPQDRRGVRSARTRTPRSAPPRAARTRRATRPTAAATTRAP